MKHRRDETPLSRGLARPRLLALALGAWVAIAPRLALADLEKALSLFEEGQAAKASGDTDAACALFGQSLTEHFTEGAQIEVARCHYRQGRVIEALNAYRLVSALAKKHGMAAELFEAETRLDDLSQKVSLATIVVPEETRAIAGLRVLLDGEEVPSERWGEALPLTGGEHHIEAAAYGREPRRWSLQPSPGAAREVVVLFPEPAPICPAAAPVMPTQAPPPAPPPRPAKTVWPYAGAALVGFGGVGLVFAATAGRLSGDDESDAQAATTLSSVGLAAGSVGLAAGVGLFALREEEVSWSSRTSAALFVGAGGAALLGGAATGLAGLDLQKTLEAGCKDKASCPEQQANIASYDRLRVLSGVSLGLGAALAGTGAGLLLWGAPEGAAEEVGQAEVFSVSPYFTAGGGGVTGLF